MTEPWQGRIMAPAANFRRGAVPTRHQQRRTDAVLQLSHGLSGAALDYGSGWGDLAARLAPQFDRIVGVDVDPERVAFASAEFAPIAFSQCRPDGLDFPDASFDVVYSIVVLHFAPSPPAFLAECHRVLRPGGHLVIMIQNPESMWMTARRLRRGRPVRQHWGGGTVPEFRAFLAANRFPPEAEAGFYDPPFDRVRTAGDVLLGVLNAVGHATGWSRHWSYVGFRCRRADA
jgi:SAM-dependent methyltransferase